MTDRRMCSVLLRGGMLTLSILVGAHAAPAASDRAVEWSFEVGGTQDS